MRCCDFKAQCLRRVQIIYTIYKSVYTEITIFFHFFQTIASCDHQSTKVSSCVLLACYLQFWPFHKILIMWYLQIYLFWQFHFVLYKLIFFVLSASLLSMFSDSISKYIFNSYRSLWCADIQHFCLDTVFVSWLLPTFSHCGNSFAWPYYSDLLSSQTK